jgi:hypothetical protein
MGSWSYAYFFPAPQKALQPALAARCLLRHQGVFAKEAFAAKIVDDEGYLDFFGDQFQLREPFGQDVIARLESGEQFQVSCHCYGVYAAFGFIREGPQPHISCGWHRRLFLNMNAANRAHYLDMLRDFAKMADAAYTILVDDAPDDFDRRLVEIDGVYHLDLTCNHKYGHGVKAVWIDTTKAVSLPAGVEYGLSTELGDGFVQYKVI